MKVKLEHWEDDEFIINIDDEPMGRTVTFGAGKIIEDWLLSNSDKLCLKSAHKDAGSCANND